MGKGSSGHFHGTAGDRGTADLGGLFAGGGSVHGFPATLHEGRQGKHMPGHNNYVKGRSIFYGSTEDAQRLIREFGGRGTWRGKNKETVDFGRIIGKHIDRDTGESTATKWGTIHYSKSGAHIVPSRPRKKRG
ncbi:MAG: hypothetical protein LBK67_04565 [Coriobacteriales bacterium]|jgi:hypothetical protein|nr:hypothetical protein [Coriobacteriales bacterium]